jgi:transposase
MKRFVEQEERSQITLFPECLDDYVSEDNPVRVVDVFVEGLHLAALGFEGVTPAKTGRLAPDFQTIVNFRKDNGPAIRNACRQFIVLCRRLDLLTASTVAIDGSKFRAVNNRDKYFTQAKLQRRIKDLEECIVRYLMEMDTADGQEPEIAELRTERIKDKIAALKEQLQAMHTVEEALSKAPDGQLSQTDPDARSMKTRGTGVVGYNVQASVETRHHLILDHEVTNIPSDRAQLSSMATRARDALQKESITALAGRGYYNSEELLRCRQEGIDAIVPKSAMSSAKADDRLGRDDFIYDPQKDEYRCPAGDRLIHRMATIEHGMTFHQNWSSTVEHTFGTLKLWMGRAHFLTRTLKRVASGMSLHVLAYNMKRVINIVKFEALLKVM